PSRLSLASPSYIASSSRRLGSPSYVESSSYVVSGASTLQQHQGRAEPGRSTTGPGPGLTDYEREASAFVSSVADTNRAREAFQRSPLIRALWPAAMAKETLPYFDIQAAINRVMWEGPNPLGRI